jgi:competence protein ComEC
MERAFPRWVVFFCLGLVVGVRIPLPPVIWALPALGLLALVLLKVRLGVRGTLVFGMVVFFSLGIAHSRRICPSPLPKDHISRWAHDQQVDVEGRVLGAPQFRRGGMRFVVETHYLHGEYGTKAVSGKLLIMVYRGETDLSHGDMVLIRCRLETPQGPGNPGTFNWRNHLALKGIHAVGYLSSPEGILLLRHEEGWWLRRWVEGFRKRLHGIIRESFPDPSREILSAVLLGERWAVEDPLRDAFQEFGISHLLAISGLHLGILGLMTFWIFHRLLVRIQWVTLRFSADKLAVVMSLPVIWGYSAVAGMGSATQRALWMATALALGLLLDRIRSPYHVLSLAALLVLVVRPSSIFELSFQLSFLAVCGILYAVPLWQEALLGEALSSGSLIQRLLRKTALAAFVTASAFLATLPLTALYFHRVSYVSIPANLLMVPWMGLGVLPVGLMGIALLPLWEAAGMALLWICAWSAQLMGDALMWAADSLSLAVWVPIPRPWEVVAFYLTLVCISNIHRHVWARWGSAALGVLWFLAVAIQVMPFYSNGHLRIHVLDVGHGLSVLVESPGEGAILIDGGGARDDSVDVGERRVAPVLWSLRIMGLQGVVLTHPHPDHINGLRFILKSFAVGHLADNGPRSSSRPYRRFLEAAEEQGLRPEVLRRGRSFPLGRALVEVLWPPSAMPPFESEDSDSAINNASLVLRISMGRFSLLLPGDIEAPAERALTRLGGLESTVLVAPHHGSLSSNTEGFLRAVNPAFIVVSGSGGARGGLNQVVRSRYERQGARIFHTSRDGMITFETDGEDLRVYTYRSREKVSLYLPPSRPDAERTNKAKALGG